MATNAVTAFMRRQLLPSRLRCCMHFCLTLLLCEVFLILYNGHGHATHTSLFRSQFQTSLLKLIVLEKVDEIQPANSPASKAHDLLPLRPAAMISRPHIADIVFLLWRESYYKSKLDTFRASIKIEQRYADTLT